MKHKAGPRQRTGLFPRGPLATIFLLRQKNGARDGTRTRDNHVGNVELYQLSYSRSKIDRYGEEKI